ncbi:hypothetical protein D3C85_1882650 [compost metagenome]
MLSDSATRFRSTPMMVQARSITLRRLSASGTTRGILATSAKSTGVAGDRPELGKPTTYRGSRNTGEVCSSSDCR